MAVLDQDLLIKIVDKLVFEEATLKKILDFVQGKKFMLVNRACKRAFLSQFSLVKSIVLQGENHLYDTRSSCLMDESTCFINVDKDKWLVAFLFQENKEFEPKNLKIFDYLSEFQPDGLSVMECFSNLLGLDEAGLDLSGFKAPELMLESLEVEDTGKCLVELDKLLTLNAVKVEMVADADVTETYYSFPDSTTFSPVSAALVENIKIIHDILNKQNSTYFSAKKSSQLLSFIFSSCVNLQKLHVWMKIYEQKNSDGIYILNNLLQAVKGMKDVVLPPLLKEGCFIQVELISGIIYENDEDAFELNKELFSIGEPLDDEFTMRHEVKFDGRAELSFSIEEYEETLAVEPIAISDEKFG